MGEHLGIQRLPRHKKSWLDIVGPVNDVRSHHNDSRRSASLPWQQNRNLGLRKLAAKGDSTKF